ncbi:MAG: hypothetical protein ACLFQV_02800 [Vulcanimicrobiota bacterium]
MVRKKNHTNVKTASDDTNHHDSIHGVALGIVKFGKMEDKFEQTHTYPVNDPKGTAELKKRLDIIPSYKNATVSPSGKAGHGPVLTSKYKKRGNK